ncbi:DNA mismatch repair endonuclease MutL [Petrachloros mirabilis]
MSSAICSTAIRVLSGEVVSRIAAGEVVERPAAVVKELVENSLDAGSRHILIDVKDGGVTLIRVTDDGEGIRRGDLLLAFERHATSKIKSDKDLVSIRTMGFRGEALPSIASISKVQVTSATRQDSVGAQLTLVGGMQEGMGDVPPIPGTKIEVSDLFYNQPARKKFLKSTSTEFSHITTVVQQAGLAWPSVHFRLTHNGHEILNYPAVASDRDRILQVYRSAFLDKSIDIRARMAGYALSGMIIDPVHARSSRIPQDLFVNRRPIRNAAVFHAVTDGYGSFLPKGHHSTFVLFLDVDPERIDVNVHPAKREIRFADQEAIHQFVRHAVRHALSGSERAMLLSLRPSEDARTALSPAPLSPEKAQEMGSPFPSIQEATEPSGVAPSEHEPPGSGAKISPQSLFAGEAVLSYSGFPIPGIVPFGQILRTYLVAQVGQELQVIDQHTAHERVLFQRLWRKWLSREIASQPLLIPEPIDLTVAQRTLLQKHLGDLEQLGLFIEPFGATAFVLRAVPVGVGPLNGGLLIQDLLEDLTERDSVSSLEARAQPILASLACRSAVQAGRLMVLPEIEQLIRDWVEEGLIMTCPHGRRTAFRLSNDELDKLFGRVGWS